MALSEELTSVEGLPHKFKFAAEYLERLKSVDASGVAALIERPGSEQPAAAERLMADEESCRRVVPLWYASATHDGHAWSFDPGHYFSSLMWEIVGAHRPALAGGYSGHWMYPPEE